MSDGFKFGAFKIVPVAPGHEHEPEEMQAKFDLAKSVIYVREQDWPLIKNEIENISTRH